jgi:hypothetical protein
MKLKDVVAKIRDRLIDNGQEPIVTTEAIYLEIMKQVNDFSARRSYLPKADKPIPSYWIALLTPDEFEEQKYFADIFTGDPNKWHENLSVRGNVETFDFGCIEYAFYGHILSEINSLRPKVDDVVALLEFLFLLGSESQQVDMFLRFISANLAKDKIVLFWNEESGLISG